MLIHKILCPVDFFSASTKAAKYAIELAKRCNASLLLLHVIEPVAPWPDAGTLDTADWTKALAKRANDELWELAKLAQAASVSTEVFVRTGLVDVTIRSIIRKHNVDFVVMGTHGLRGIERLFLGSTTERLLRTLRIPLMTIRDDKSKPERGVGHILAVTDFSEGTREAIAYALSLAKEYRAKTTLLHVLNDVQADISGVYRDHLVRGIQYELQNLTSDEPRSKGKVAVRVLTGQPIRRILGFVENENIDLIVMNIHGKTALERMTIGSTAEKIVRSSRVPVLMVPSMPVKKRRQRAFRKTA